MPNILKCKICGGDLGNIDKDVAECLYCGTKQILPKMNGDKKINLYDRADHYRNQNDFDKAAALYEQVLAEDSSDAEIYWDLVLCRYGVEYVEDPRTKKRIPTVNRTQFQSVFEDPNYKLAVRNASEAQKSILEADAKLIDNIQKGILDISNREKPYDIFICYKETDDKGNRTPDSVIAQDIYNELINKGYKVFFSRITLEDKLGSAYEPYIFAALNSAKVMIVVGTKPEHFNAVWVKNEWSRYIGMINAGEKKTLIPAFKNMNPYELPEEFAYLQAQDMDKLGFMQDLIRGIDKILMAGSSINEDKAQEIKPLLNRLYMFLEDGDFSNASTYAERILDIDPQNAEAYLGKLMVDLKLNRKNDFSNIAVRFEDNPNYTKCLKFASNDLKAELISYSKSASEAYAQKKDRIKNKSQRSLKYLGVAIALLVIVAIAYLAIGKTTESLTNNTDNEVSDSENVVVSSDTDLSAEELFANGDYQKALEVAKGMAPSQDRNALINKITYEYAMKCISDSDYLKARQLLADIIRYSDASDKYDEVNMILAEDAYEKEKYDDVYTYLSSTKNESGKKMYEDACLKLGKQSFDSKQFEEAIKYLEDAGDSGEVVDLLNKSYIAYGKDLIANNQYGKAMSIFYNCESTDEVEGLIKEATYGYLTQEIEKEGIDITKYFSYADKLDGYNDIDKTEKYILFKSINGTYTCDNFSPWTLVIKDGRATLKTGDGGSNETLKYKNGYFTWMDDTFSYSNGTFTNTTNKLDVDVIYKIGN